MEKRNKSYIDLGLGAGATFLSMVTVEGGRELAGADVAFLSSSSVISTLSQTNNTITNNTAVLSLLS